MKKFITTFFCVIVLHLNVMQAQKPTKGYITYTNSSLDLINVAANSAINFQGNFTVSLNVNFDDVDFWNMFFCYNKFGGLEISYTGNHTSKAYNLVSSVDGSAANRVTADWLAENNTWYHIVFIKSGNVYTFYVNGVKMGFNTITVPVPNFSANDFYIGKYMQNGLYFKGKMDEVSIWNKALSPAYIKDTLSKPLLGTESGLILYYDMDTTGAGQGIKVRNKAKSTGKTLDGITVGQSASPYFTMLTAVPIINDYNNSLIYPNPTNGKLHINYTGSLSEVIIYNALGERIYSENLHTIGTDIDLSDQPKGVYLYQIRDENQLLINSGKIIIQ